MITIKRQNHRLHPCSASNKQGLLSFLLESRLPNSTLILCSDSSLDTLKAIIPNYTIISDSQLSSITSPVETLINYDFPEKALNYIVRIKNAGTYVLTLADEEEMKKLYSIEVLLGKTILQEIIKNFEPIAAEIKVDTTPHVERDKHANKSKSNHHNKGKEYTQSRNYDGQNANHKQYKPKFNDENSRSEPKSKADLFSKKEKAKPKFLGKDENGKPIFSGKTRERNHYWDGKPRTDEEKANKTPFGSKPKFYGKSDMPQSQGKKSYNPDVKKEYTKRPGKRISVKSLEPKSSGNE